MTAGFDIRDFIFGGHWWQPIDKRIRPDLYDWSSYSPLQKQEFVKNALLKAVRMVLAGEAVNVEDVLRSMIAKVELGESWQEWKRKNPGFVHNMKQAQHDVDTANNLIAATRRGEDVTLRLQNLHFQYINKNTLNSLLSSISDINTTNTQLSQPYNAAFGRNITGIISNNPAYALLAGAALLIGILAFSSSGKGRHYIQTRSLK